MAGEALSGAASGAAAGSAAGPWGAAIGGLVGLASGIIGGNAASKARKKANAIEEKRLALASSLQKRYFDTFVPLQDRALSLAGRRIDPGVEAAAAGADVERQAATQRAIMLRDLGRRGIDPSSGAAVDATTRLSLGTALGRAAAETVARRNAGRDELSNLLAVSDMGAPLLGQASAGLSSVGAARDARAAAAEQAQGQAWNNVGENVADLINYFTTRKT
jgi:hypothetical protein